MQQQKNIIVGISGASGSLLSVKLLEILQKIDHIKTHLVISKSALITCNLEVDKKYSEIKKLADFSYNINDISAAISSGSFLTDGMIIIPCSVKTLAEIASGHSTSLLTRAADVILKERRKLLLILRETPYTSIHIDNMQKVTKAGAVIMPPVPAFYNKPQTIEEMVEYSVVRILDQFGVNIDHDKRWQ